LVLDDSGNLFGTTFGGGANGEGSIFEIAADGHTVTTLASFNGDNGSTPAPTLVRDHNGNLFGTTYSGDGTVFELAAGRRSITTLGRFNAATTGSTPASDMVLDSHGNLFGTTASGGPNQQGGVFEIVAGSTTITPLVFFGNGSAPYAGLTRDSQGNLFGATV